MSGNEDIESSRKDFRSPYSPRHPIPTIQRYRETQEARRQAEDGQEDDDSEQSKSRTQAAYDTYKQYRYGDQDAPNDTSKAPYHGENKNDVQEEQAEAGAAEQTEQPQQAHIHEHQQEHNENRNEGADYATEDTSQATVTNADPKSQRKQMKKRSGRAEREVTDPVTHLPLTIHDFTEKDLKNIPENQDPPGKQHRTGTGLSNKQKEEHELQAEKDEVQQSYDSMDPLFPPPDFANAKKELARVHQLAATASTFSILTIFSVLFLLCSILEFTSKLKATTLLAIVAAITLGLGGAVSWVIQGWLTSKVRDVWDNQVWEAERQQGKDKTNTDTPESTEWLNSLLKSIWPLVNPDLFTSLADTLEDVMQASLPSMIRMVSVDDLGQGSESIRILGVRWLPTGAAASNVSKDGKLDKSKGGQSDRKVAGEGEIQDSTAQSDNEKNNGKGSDNQQDSQNQEQDNENLGQGMEAEEGDFVNLELAFAYRARSSGLGISTRAKNAHLYLGFYLPANIKIPVWVELRGIVGTIRVRLQLGPDPPFFNLCTLTFLGQPKVDVSCVPLVKRGLNIMDLPLISNFVQSSVDAAASQYVAPKSLTLDLKDMISGDDFKKDTAARGVLVVRVKRAFDFKEGDSSIPLIKDGSADAYVSAGWAKFGKPVWSTRVITSDMEPSWDEVAYILITPEELNVDERLRMQLWDSDRTSADDDLGRIELDLKQLMRDPKSNGKMWDRQDGFRALKAGEEMPGKLDWSVGYFSKTRILDSQLERQDADPDIRTVDQLKQKAHESSERKLREAKRDETKELDQQKAQDYKEKQDEMMIAAPPPDEYLSGILSIQIHQITGLELEQLKKTTADKKENDNDEAEGGDDLPSSYCTIIINHTKVFKTRTKPKNSKPFFNAGCERFIRNWQETDVLISVRDARVHEDDAILGVIHLPLATVLKDRAQLNGFWPLAGGVGYGRARISMVFRSVQLQAPRSLLGWDWGTLEVKSVAAGDDLQDGLRDLRLKVRTNLARGKMHTDGKSNEWKKRDGKSVHLPVRKRYCSAMVIEFRDARPLKDSTPAYCVLWLKDIPDDSEQTLTLPVWKYEKNEFKRAQACVLEKYGEQTGSITITLNFHAGLSGYHQNLASKDKNLFDVMEVLDVAHDNGDDDDYDREGEGQSSSDSDDDDENEHHHHHKHKQLTPATTDSEGGLSNGNKDDDESLQHEGKRGIIDEAKEYKNHYKQLHRRHRGLMQWKAPRTMQWMKNKVDHVGQKATNVFSHHSNDSPIETEV